MRRYFLRCFLGVMIACLMVGASLNALASPAYSRDLLIQAYSVLAQANHDYKGHRIAAMHQVKAACKLLGVEIRGDNAVHEPQGLSHDQLRIAQSMLVQARGGLIGKPLRHVDQAIRQISIALAEEWRS